MGLLVTEINELRQMLNAFDSGKLSAEDLNTKLGVYSQTEKRAKLILKAVSLGMSKDELTGGKIDTKKIPYNRTGSRGT